MIIVTTITFFADHRHNDQQDEKRHKDFPPVVSFPLGPCGAEGSGVRRSCWLRLMRH